MRILPISINYSNINNTKQYNQNTFLGKTPKSTNITDTFQKSANVITDESTIMQLRETARQFSSVFFKTIYPNDVKNLQQKYKDILKISDKDEFLDNAFTELKKNFGLDKIPITLNKNFKYGEKAENIEAAADITTHYSDGYLEVSVDKRLPNKDLFESLTHELRHALQQLKIYQYASKKEYKKLILNKFLNGCPTTDKTDIRIMKEIVDNDIDAMFEFFKNTGIKKSRKKDGGYFLTQKLLETIGILEKESVKNYIASFAEKDAIHAEIYIMRAIFNN